MTFNDFWGQLILLKKLCLHNVGIDKVLKKMALSKHFIEENCILKSKDDIM